MSNPVTVTVSESNAVAGASVTVTVTNAAVASGAGKTIVSPGGIADLTSVQQGEVGQGTIVVTTDGYRYVYSGAGSKTNSASYVILADITPDWSALSGKPSTFAPSAHASTHGSGGADAITVAVSQVTGLQTALDGKQASGSYAAASHGHEIADVSGLSTALDGKQATLATGTEGDVLTYASGQWTAAASGGGSQGPQGDPGAQGDPGPRGFGAFEYTAARTGANQYQVGEIVFYNGSYYICIASNDALPPSSSVEYWQAYTFDGGLPAGSQSDLLAYDEGEWAAKTLTQVLPPASVGGDTLVWDNVTATWTAQQPPAGIFPPAEPSDGDVLTWSATNSAWESQPPSGGGGGGDYLPLAGGTMTGNISFDGTSGQAIGKGWFDTNRGGNYGISLYCSIGYQVNWQAGWLTTTEQDLSTPRPLYLDSAAGTTLRVWDASENEGVEVSHTGIAFADGTTQTTAYTGGGGASLPVAPINNGSVLTWNDSASLWEPQSIPAQVPASASTNDVLSWNGSAWVAVMPSTPGLPSGSTGQYLKYDGGNWVAASAPVPSSNGANSYVRYDAASNLTAGQLVIPNFDSSFTYQTDDVAWYSGQVWRATNGGHTGNTPAAGSSWWTPLTPAPLPSSATSGDVLTYDSGTSAWIAAAPSGGGGGGGGGGLTVGTDGVTFDTTGCVLKGDSTGGVTITYQGTQKFGFYCDPSLSPGVAFKFPDGTLQTTAYTGGAITSVTTGINGADQITNIVSLTQAEYDALASTDASTFYVITD